MFQTKRIVVYVAVLLYFKFPGQLCFNVVYFYVWIRKTVSCDSTKPLIIPAGSDSFSQIGEHSATLWPKVVKCI